METQVVTSETLQAFNAERLNLAPATEPAKEEPTKVEAEPEKVEEAKSEEEKPADKAEEKAEEHEEHKKKAGKPIAERFSELTAQKKAAMARAEEAEKRAKDLEERLRSAEAPKTERDPNAEPNPDDFKDAFAYAKELAKFAADKAIKEDRAKQAEERMAAERQKVAESWNQKVSELRKTVNDYEEVVIGSEVQVSDGVRDAIVESDIGPQLIYYLAKNPDEAERLNGLNARKSILELYKIEVGLTRKPERILEGVSKAPAPISPVKGVVSSNPLGADGEFKGSFEEYKALRRAGKIK